MVGVRKTRRWVTITLFLLPGLVGLIAFNLYPIVMSAFVSFTDWDLLTEPEYVGFDNYIDVFTGEKSRLAILNTFTFIIGYIPIILIASLALALLLNRKIRFLSFYRAAVFIPVITSWVAVSIIWRWILNGQNGLLNYLLSLVGVQGPIWLQDFFWAMPSIVMVTVWKDVGFFAIIILAGLQDISEDYYEAAKIDGAGTFQQLIKISIPMVTPSMFFVVIISLINSFQLFDQVLVMTGGGPAGSTSTMVEQVYRNAFQITRWDSLRRNRGCCSR
ncbi:sugar ABC transporter permease [Paenibacillus sp. LHD-117]|uniref:carbohydrate ABC transporter permease n=1 Tax=Paenibacillus sp. LHD-117 TaxID=3071412 RepID=UPI0027E1C097|nr:sugar ABC transporter permease [Paenibacillus sp. LHD-117]MDQ6421012.1 sugar ABC transporter permease [Paenibacillus sp. LHD-117]